MKQKEMVLNIVKLHEPIRTEQIKIIAMREGVSCADRYLRWLQEEGKIVGKYANGHKGTKTWRLIRSPKQVDLFKEV